jgi:hypothetical protein
MRRPVRAHGVAAVAVVIVLELTAVGYTVLPSSHGQPADPTSATVAGDTAPRIDVWYGDTQVFGAHGHPQQWVNILGNASAASGLASLSYSLNGGPEVDLAIGPNGTRLQDVGDFNAEIDWGDLRPGANTVRLTAEDAVGQFTHHTVTVNNVVHEQSSPMPYTIDWARAGAIQNVAQVVDGKWAIEGNTVRTLAPGYDRLLDLGDMAWSAYTITAEVTVHTIAPTGGAVGIVTGWHGHTTDQYGTDLPDQPRVGHPFPAFFHYSGPNNAAYGFDILSNHNIATDYERFLAMDNSGMTLTPGVPYIFKAEVTPNDLTSDHFKFKAWPAGTAEPSAWNLETNGPGSQGSILLATHMDDVSFGPVTVTAASDGR